MIGYKAISLFSGGGGFDLAASQAGLDVILCCEPDKHCQTVLRRYNPDAEIIGTVQELIEKVLTDDEYQKYRQPYISFGGDPCQAHSTAGKGKSKQPDLSGFHLAAIAALQPRWVVRENVSQSNSIEFCEGLRDIGYACFIFDARSEDFTPQQRRRYYIVAARPDARQKLRNIAKINQRFIKQRRPERFYFKCLVTADRGSTIQNYHWDGKELRNLTVRERELLQGYPVNYFPAGIPKISVLRMIGNSITVPVARRIFELILEADND